MISESLHREVLLAVDVLRLWRWRYALWVTLRAVSIGHQVGFIHYR
jgi:hypothetical protein